MTAQADRQRPAQAEEDSAKRRQILDGARRMFMTQGFDAASMGEIAREAGVSKGTLYVYFQSKEDLFQAIIQHECDVQSALVFNLDPADHDVAAVLTRLGTTYIQTFWNQGKVPALRTIIAIAERMPEVGRAFYEAGPARGVARLAAYLQAQNDAGVLQVDDCEVAAAQFIDACQSTMFKPLLFNFGETPSPERVAHVVGVAVRTFLAAYRPR